jgi:hypothetical protein
MIEGQGEDGTTRTLTFYKRNFVLVDDIGWRANFLRDSRGRVVWFRLGAACSDGSASAGPGAARSHG